MKKLILATAVATTLLAPQAFAQNKNFEGFSVGLSANFNNAKAEGTGGSVSDNSTTAGLKAAYGWALTDKFVLSVGASYDTGKAKAFSNATQNVWLQDTTVLSIEPGYKVSNAILAYAKLGYASTKAVYEPAGGASSSQTYSGTAYGVGVRAMLGKNWSADLEVQQLGFDTKMLSTTDTKPSATVTSIGVNYHF